MCICVCMCAPSTIMTPSTTLQENKYDRLSNPSSTCHEQVWRQQSLLSGLRPPSLAPNDEALESSVTLIDDPQMQQRHERKCQLVVIRYKQQSLQNISLLLRISLPDDPLKPNMRLTLFFALNTTLYFPKAFMGIKNLVDVTKNSWHWSKKNINESQ